MAAGYSVNLQAASSCLNPIGKPLNSAAMNFVYASLAWVVIGIILGVGILLAVKGSLWLLILSFLGFIFAVAKIGCLK
jgi:hypothetical protein